MPRLPPQGASMKNVMNQKEFAAYINRSEAFVSGLNKKNVLVRNEKGLIDVEKSADAFYKLEELASPYPHHRAHALQLEEEREAKQSGSAPENTSPVEGIESLNLRLKKAEADKREHEAEIARLDRELKEKKQIMADAVRFSLNDHTAVIRTLHENAPDRLTPLIDPLQTYEEKHAAISEFMEQVQLEIYESSMRALARLVSEE
jgi:hypothetical protein